MNRGFNMILLVIRAANLLRVDELEVFRLAYRFCFHRAAEPRNVKAAFDEYLDTQLVPSWVVHFARSVVDAYHRGSFEPAMFGVYPPCEVIPLSWSLVFQTPLSVPFNEIDDLLVA
jgi:hypothetical protein